MHAMCYIYYVHFIFVGKTRLAQGTVINYVHNYLLYVVSYFKCVLQHKHDNSSAYSG